ncbi:MAG: glutamate mutase L, partial [Clostridia bacterium]|nr:glutamate mutase L [Clostridia bacterium]
QSVIRALFLRRIIQAKGLSRQQTLVSGILMPTPAAVMRALALLAGEVGDLLAVDLGGATTDVYSIADGLPTEASTILRGLPEPREKRTVEGDIGMRFSARGIVESVGVGRIESLSGLSPEAIERNLNRIETTAGILPATDEDELSQLDFAMALSAIDTAVTRHVGTLEQIFTPAGILCQQTGKDLRTARTMVFTGGVFAHGAHREQIAKRAAVCDCGPLSLRPRNASPFLDSEYILAAMGLLSKQYPQAALSIIRRSISI